MDFPKELSNKYRVIKTLINEGDFYRAKVFDFTQNKVVSLTIIRNIELSVFDAIKNRLNIERKLDAHSFLVELYSLEHLKTNKLYYTQEYGESLSSLDLSTIDEKVNIRDWFYKLAIPIFYQFLDVANQKHNSHGIISPYTIYYCNGSLKIGDYVLGVILDLNLPLIFDSPWYCDSFFNPSLHGINADVYALLKIIQFMDSDNISKVFQKIETICERTTLAESVKEIIYNIFSQQDNEPLIEKYLLFMKPLCENSKTYEQKPILYKTDKFPLLFKMISSWQLSDFSDIIVLHINHYLNDILELNNILSSMFNRLVYVVVPYSIETKILSNQDYHTYYHEIKERKYIIKKDSRIICTTDSFYSAMYESIKIAFTSEIIPLVENGKKIIIIEDGGFHYSVVSELMKTHTLLENSIIGTIEQTTSGIRRYNEAQSKSNIHYPVLSVARSRIKMRVESHFIARRVIDELNYLLYMANNFLSFHNVLLIGYGIIGRNISKSLSTLKCNVTVYDINDEIRLLAKKEGNKIINTTQEVEFLDNQIIIGATGESAFTSSMFFSFVTSNARKIYLASASSKRIEFQNIISFFEAGEKDNNYQQIINQIENIRIVQNSYGITYSFRYKDIDKNIILIANGYPVNFYRKNIISLTESIIDLIYCEMFILVQYLLTAKAQLTPTLYLLGTSELSHLDLQEELLVKAWFDLLALQSDYSDETIWNTFDTHPFEDTLRKNVFPNILKEPQNENIYQA